MLPVLFLRGEPTTHTLLSHTNARFDFRTMLNTFLWDTKVLSCPTHSPNASPGQPLPSPIPSTHLPSWPHSHVLNSMCKGLVGSTLTYRSYYVDIDTV